MTGASPEVERIVSEVLRRLRSAPSHSDDTADAGDAAEKVEERVISLAVLEGRLAGRRRLLVPRGAVLTPAAKDELRARRIEVRRVPEPVNVQQRVPVLPPYVAIQSGHAVERLRTVVRHVESCCEVVEFASVDEAVGGAVSAVTNGRAAAVWSDRPSRAVCLANRHAEIWAAYGWDLSSTAEALQDAGANLLVLDNRCQNQFMQRAILRKYLRAKQVNG